MSTATVNGVDLAYVEQGQGEPVLFVHGGVGDYRAWDQQMNAFGAGYRAIALSCRGYWPNPELRPDESITLDTFVDDVLVYRLGPQHYLLVVNAGRVGADYDWIAAHIKDAGDVVALYAWDSEAQDYKAGDLINIG